jgi:hypothetical protein
VLAGDGDQQLARERVFAAIPPAIKLARYPSLNWRVRGRAGAIHNVICGNDAGDSRPGEKGGTKRVTHTCEPLARLIHTQAFECDANSEKFVSCIHSVPQPKTAICGVTFSPCPAGSPWSLGRTSFSQNRRRDTYLTPRPAVESSTTEPRLRPSRSLQATPPIIRTLRVLGQREAWVPLQHLASPVSDERHR